MYKKHIRRSRHTVTGYRFRRVSAKPPLDKWDNRFILDLLQFGPNGRLLGFGRWYQSFPGRCVKRPSVFRGKTSSHMFTCSTYTCNIDFYQRQPFSRANFHTHCTDATTVVTKSIPVLWKNLLHRNLLNRINKIIFNDSVVRSFEGAPIVATNRVVTASTYNGKQSSFCHVYGQ